MTEVSAMIELIKNEISDNHPVKVGVLVHLIRVYLEARVLREVLVRYYHYESNIQYSFQVSNAEFVDAIKQLREHDSAYVADTAQDIVDTFFGEETEN